MSDYSEGAHIPSLWAPLTEAVPCLYSLLIIITLFHVYDNGIIHENGTMKTASNFKTVDWRPHRHFISPSGKQCRNLNALDSNFKTLIPFRMIEDSQFSEAPHTQMEEIGDCRTHFNEWTLNRSLVSLIIQYTPHVRAVHWSRRVIYKSINTPITTIKGRIELIYHDAEYSRDHESWYDPPYYPLTESSRSH